MMKQPLVLQTWLDIATRGLCDEAKARIRDDIQSHVVEAMRSRLKDGVAPEVTMQQAVKDLGDPRKARLEFRRIHLTTRQARYINILTDPKMVAAAKKGRRWMLPLAVAWLAAALTISFMTVPINKFELAGLLTLFVLFLWNPSISQGTKSLKRLLSLNTLRWSLIIAACTFYMLGDALDKPDPYFRLFSLIMVGLLWMYIPYSILFSMDIYRKLKDATTTKVTKGAP